MTSDDTARDCNAGDAARASSSSTAPRSRRRDVVKVGVAVVGGAAAAGYVSPALRTLGIPRALALSGSPPPPPPPPPSGCTLGFWKNHPSAWQGFSTSAHLGSIWSFPPDINSLASVTLLDALSFHGGPDALGGAQILLKQAVAALLNSANSNLSYPRTTAQVIADVQAALNSDNKDTMTAESEVLDSDNSLEGPFCG